jgi:mycofactocin precursor
VAGARPCSYHGRMSTPAPATTAAAEPTADAAEEPALVTDELLVEEISIDGMCGVY